MTEDTFRKLVRTAREAWPGVMVPEDTFAALLAAQDTSDPSLLPAAWLWLALGCARGDAEALRAFEASTFPGARAALRRMRLSADTIAEVLQTLRERLLVAQPDKPAKILGAAAHGKLPAQIRLAAVRIAIDLHRRDHRREPGDKPLLRAIAPDEDPEIATLKDQQRGALKAALEQALAGLSPKERNVLQLNFVHGLSIDEIGRSYKVHRATVARWLAAIRERLNQESRRLLRERQGLGEEEVDSLIKLVESRTEVSFFRLLGSGAA